MAFSPSRLESALSDSSVWGLLIANLTTIIVAVKQDWSLVQVMWVYWCQSVIIGLFNFWRMMSLERFSTRGISSSSGPVPPTREARREMAWFFLAHYGIFHFVYLVFLLIALFRAKLVVFAPEPLLLVLLFLINHAWSFFRNRGREADSVPNIGTLMLLPYARVIPMHLTLVFGGLFIANKYWLVFFLLLKTLADLIAHVAEHARRRMQVPDAEK